ncbi:hypothetical protein AB0B25_13685 [Nocardia sp. NPDC049190]|uniref:hypothetical protein n=1 Tax=Nocardia sp. NPDC049190 TaxID=3155650 RepID=UPI003403CA08
MTNTVDSAILAHELLAELDLDNADLHDLVHSTSSTLGKTCHAVYLTVDSSNEIPSSHRDSLRPLPLCLEMSNAGRNQASPNGVGTDNQIGGHIRPPTPIPTT